MADVEYRCFVGGLAWATDDRSLEQAFSQFGDITDSKVHRPVPSRPDLLPMRLYACVFCVLDL